MQRVAIAFKCDQALRVRKENRCDGKGVRSEGMLTVRLAIIAEPKTP